MSNTNVKKFIMDGADFPIVDEEARADIVDINNSLTQKEDYTLANEYYYSVVEIGHIVVVSGVVYGKAQNEYCGTILPAPNYTGFAFQARNQSDGTFVTMRCGGSSDNFRIYRSANMANGVQFAFTFSYVKA